MMREFRTVYPSSRTPDEIADALEPLGFHGRQARQSVYTYAASGRLRHGADGAYTLTDRGLHWRPVTAELRAEYGYELEDGDGAAT